MITLFKSILRYVGPTLWDGNYVFTKLQHKRPNRMKCHVFTPVLLLLLDGESTFISLPFLSKNSSTKLLKQQYDFLNHR